MVETVSKEKLKEAEKGDRKLFTKFADMPTYVYVGDHRVACPECYTPVPRSHRDGRCELCLHDKNLLPVNYRKIPKKRRHDEDDDE